MKKGVAAPGYEADCKKCIYRKREEERIYACKKTGSVNPHRIACCYFRTKKDTKETLEKRKALRRQFWLDALAPNNKKKNLAPISGYKYENISPKFRKYIDEV